MKTIKQIAFEIGVSPQAVRDKISKLGLKSTVKQVGKSYAIEEQTEIAIKHAFTKYLEQPANEAIIEQVPQSEAKFEQVPQSEAKFEQVSQCENKYYDKLINMLQNELNVKNRQIEQYEGQITELHNRLSEAHALHGGTIQQQLTVCDGGEGERPKRGFFGILRRKKGN